MTTTILQQIPHHQRAAYEAQGWVVVNDQSDCHHGAYSVLMRAPDGWQQVGDVAARIVARIAKKRGL